MKKILFLILVAVLSISLVATFSLAGCKKEVAEEKVAEEEVKEENKLTIGYVPQSISGDESQVAYALGVRTAAEELGIELIEDDPDYNSTRQVEIIETFIARGVDGIIFEPTDAAVVSAGVEKANDANIPCAAILSEASNGETVISVRPDLAKMGELAAQRIVDKLEEKYGEPKGKVLSVLGLLGQEYAQRISGGLNAVFEQYENITVIEKACDWDNSLAESTTIDVITANPDIDAIFANSDYYIQGIESALITTGKLVESGKEGHIIWTSCDSFPIGLEYIEKGYVDSTSYSPASSYGYIAMNYLYDYIVNNVSPEVGDVVEAENELWSPAQIIEGNTGPALVLNTVLVDDSWDLKDSRLWANQVDVGY